MCGITTCSIRYLKVGFYIVQALEPQTQKTTLVLSAKLSASKVSMPGRPRRTSAKKISYTQLNETGLSQDDPNMDTEETEGQPLQSQAGVVREASATELASSISQIDDENIRPLVSLQDHLYG